MSSSPQSHHYDQQQLESLGPSSSSPSSSPPVLEELASSLDRGHRALSDIATGPFKSTQQALSQTHSNLHFTARQLSDSTQNLVRTQSTIETLIIKIKNAQEFLSPTN
ncbi:hypothetical protein BX616_010913 [Lobosporangium transversale]|nr:hypothetical protein BX616_010913 [Lobosporangium transversale]